MARWTCKSCRNLSSQIPLIASGQSYLPINVCKLDIIPWEEVKCANGTIRYGSLGYWMNLNGGKKMCITRTPLTCPCASMELRFSLLTRLFPQYTHGEDLQQEPILPMEVFFERMELLPLKITFIWHCSICMADYYRKQQQCGTMH